MPQKMTKHAGQFHLVD